MTKVTLLAGAALLCFAGFAQGQTSHSGHGSHGGHASPAAPNPQVQPDREAGGDGDRQGRQAGPAAPTSTTASTGASAATQAYEAANLRMHKDMAITFTGDPDVDFARSMVPHHQGAVEMARIVLQHGKDPELKKLAQEVIASQEREVGVLREWLQKRGQ